MGVIVIIGILAGLTLGAAGAVRRHATRSRAKAEIAALQAACERFYADNQFYPAVTNPAVICDPTLCFDPSGKDREKYRGSGLVLFTNLLGSTTFSNRPTGKRYFEPKPSMVSASSDFFLDPWGRYPYGYWSDGTNAPLIWSTANQANAAGTNLWITSWPKL